MKTIYLILQSKGGVGKSLLSWLIANNEKENKNVLFIDLDESTKTSYKRLPSIIGEKRVKQLKISDDSKRVEREKFMDAFSALQSHNYEKIIIDFGATESEEFLRLIQYELTASELSEELFSQNIKLKIVTVVSGNDSFLSSLYYQKTIFNLTNTFIKNICCINEGTFTSNLSFESAKLDISAEIGEENIFAFGNIGNTPSGKEIIDMITMSTNPDKIGFLAKLRFKKVLKQVENILND